MGFLENTFKRFGFIPKQKVEALTREAIYSDLRNAPETLQREIKQAFDELPSLRIVADPNLLYKKHIELGRKLQHARQYARVDGPVHQAAKRFQFRTNGNIFGYTPASARIWGLFANPMEVFSYLYDNWWAFKASVDIIDTQVESGGFTLKSNKKNNDARILEVYRLIKELKLDEMFSDCIVDLVKYGNFYVLIHRSALNGKTVTKFEQLNPDQLLPVFHAKTMEIIGYRYERGLSLEFYTTDQILHLSMRGGQKGLGIGTPPILPAVLDIEAALHASMLNNTLFQKGGILGVILAMEEPKQDESIDIQHSSDWLDIVQEKLNAESGARGGHGMVALNGVKNVHKLTEPGQVDSNWTHGRDYAAKVTGELTGVPPEKLGLVRSSALQYSPALVEDSVNAMLDDTVNRLTGKAAKFFNRMLEMLEILDVKIQPTRRTGAKTKTAAEALNTLASGGGYITRNEARMDWLHMQPLPGPEGDELVNTSATIKPDTLPARSPQQNPDPDFATLEDTGAKQVHSEEGREYFSTIQVGGANDGVIQKQFF